MLVVAGSFEVDPDRRDEFVQSRVEAMTASRREAGCLEYVFAPDPVVPGRVVLYERWDSKEALGAHLAAMQANRAVAGPAPEGVPVLASEIAQYEIGAVSSLGG